MRNMRALTGITVVFLMFLCGCTAVDRWEKISNPAPYTPGPVYHPKLPPDITSLDAAKRRLRDALSGADLAAIKPLSPPELSLLTNMARLEETLKGLSRKSSYFYDSAGTLLFIETSPISVLDDRIEVSPRIVFFYKDLLDNPIVVERTSGYPDHIYHSDSIINQSWNIL